jgi:hypothetical protein
MVRRSESLPNRPCLLEVDTRQRRAVHKWGTRGFPYRQDNRSRVHAFCSAVRRGMDQWALSSTVSAIAFPRSGFNFFATATARRAHLRFLLHTARQNEQTTNEILCRSTILQLSTHSIPSTCTRTYQQKGGVGVLCNYTSIVTRGINMFAYSLEVKKNATVPRMSPIA